MNRLILTGLKLFYFILLLSVLPLRTNAQIDIGSDGDGTDVVDTPIDGGAAFLLIAGLELGVMKIYKTKNNARNI